ncbi:hornerin-like isoform X2 [Anopheles albimanus]|uniref:hornerin-like isoform X2 n=1 Tax=Anopheles albimanus TaxID=7167 RepID=UPI00163F6A7F|nr:hornerin-like isoform X2 [Anopheles albimanus]
MRLIQFTTLVLVVVVVPATVQVSGEVAEQRRRPLFRRAKPTTTSEPAQPSGISSDDSEGSETKGHQRSDPFSVTGSQPGQPGAPGGSYKPDGDKLTSFSEYSFGNHGKLLAAGGSLEETNPDGDEPAGYGASFKNHKSAGLLPTTNASKGKPATGGAFDFLARDYAKAKGSFGAAGTAPIQHDTATGGLLGSKSKSSSSLPSVSSKFAIGASGSKVTAAKLAHLDDSTEYDVYAGLGQSATGKTKLGTSGKYRTSSSTFGAGGGIKKVPFKYEDGGFGAAAAAAATSPVTTSLKGAPKTKTKFSVDDDNPLGSAGSAFDGVYGGKQQQHQQQQQSLLASKSKFNFAEPPALVKSTLSTLKHFGDGLLGNGGNGGALFHSSNSPYDLDSDEGQGLAGFHGSGGTAGGGKFGGSHHHTTYHGQPAVEESYEVVASGEHGLGKPKPYQLAKSPLGPGSSLSGGGKFATDFDVKNIKLTGDGTGAVFGGHTTKYQHHQHHQHHQGAGVSGAGKNTPPHQHTKQQHAVGHTGPHQLLHQQQHQQQQHAPHHAHAPTHATGSIANPNPLDFRPNFQLQDVPNLYPPHGAPALGAGIAAKGQIESFLNAELNGLKDESLVAQLLGQQPDGAGAAGGTGRPHYHTLQKSKEEELLEKEALRQQIEYLKAQAAKRPVDLAPSNPARPAIVSNAQKFRPVRRIPTHVRLGVKAPYPLPRIPHYNDRPYSISFKI